MPVLHASPRSRSRRVSLQFLFPLSCVRFSSTFVSHESASGLSHLWFSPFSHTSTVWSSGTVAFSPPKRCGCVFPSFPRCFSPLSFVQFLPPRSDRISPALQTGSIVPLPPFGFRFPFLLSDSSSPSSFRIPVPLPPFRFQFPFLLSDSSSPSSFRISVPLPPFGFRFYHPKFGVRFCGPRFAPKRAPHHSPEAATLVCAGEALKRFVE